MGLVLALVLVCVPCVCAQVYAFARARVHVRVSCEHVGDDAGPLFKALDAREREKEMTRLKGELADAQAQVGSGMLDSLRFQACSATCAR